MSIDASYTKRNVGLMADKIRVEKGMTIHEFCEKSGMGLKAATSYFSGKGLMRISDHVQVAYALGVEVDAMFVKRRIGTKFNSSTTFTITVKRDDFSQIA